MDRLFKIWVVARILSRSVAVTDLNDDMGAVFWDRGHWIITGLAWIITDL